MTGVKNEASKVASNPAVNILVRIGDGARGYLFFVLGLLAIQMASGKISQTADYQGAIAATAAEGSGSTTQGNRQGIGRGGTGGRRRIHHRAGQYQLGRQCGAGSP